MSLPHQAQINGDEFSRQAQRFARIADQAGKNIIVKAATQSSAHNQKRSAASSSASAPENRVRFTRTTEGSVQPNSRAAVPYSMGTTGPQELNRNTGSAASASELV